MSIGGHLGLRLGGFMLVLVLCACSRSPQSDTPPVVIRFHADSVATSLEINRQLATGFENRTGVGVEILKGPASSSERFSQYLQYLGAGSQDIDIYQIDVIWPGMLADHFVDMRDYFSEEEVDQFFPSIVENNTVNGRLVAIPWFAHAGMLYYRADLLEKYGYYEPPDSWDQMEEIAESIQGAEREAGNTQLWGYVFQGRAYEGLTCNALEWQVSSGGGQIIDPGMRITVNNPQMHKALARAAGWIGTISPPGVTTYQEEESRHLFQQGNAVFMRNWPYAYALANAPDSPIRGKINVSLLPTGGHGRAAALGGWQLGVSKYSRFPREAAEFVRYVTSYEAEKLRAVRMTVLPSRMDLYEDAEVTSAIPFLAKMKDAFLNASPRPSAMAGVKYNEVSTRYFQAVHRVLTGRKTPEESMAELEITLRNVMQR